MRHAIRWRYLLALGLVCATGTLSAGPRDRAWTGLERSMSPEEFRGAGLDKLSPEELDRLNDWLLRFLARDAVHVVKTDETIREIQKAPVRHRIVGAFNGWHGDTVFRLDNGEVWKQRLPGEYFARLQDPEIEIVKNLIGFYELKILATGRRIGVTRVE